MDAAASKRARGIASSREKVKTVRDQRRFKSNFAPSGSIKLRAPKGLNGTMFPNKVIDWHPDIGERILKDGRHNAKIGGWVLCGHLREAVIYTLSLEERATCPKTCHLYRECYGNRMHLARRWVHTPLLEQGIADEVDALCDKHEQVLIRLHVLGDFPSFEYLWFWVALLDQYENLNLFGFTAWAGATEIGAGIARVRSVYGRRFSIRNSNMTGKWGSFTVDFPTESEMIGDAIVCPEQRAALGDIDGGKHCGSCAACWSTDRPIAFVQHG